ncbi:LysR substrate-binding domain-containing protein [Paracoccus binzhouensis]|uniref:LysR substrate-binding domain-containing protein n=1 Tax=Paracoccus binzhouensis TaxID=2796149 RepID=UPI0018EEE059|nr:LysR substrate-binding domain-containing protein [Paracoccus binzhouensis]
MKNIPMELLRTFVKAIESGSFTRAGELVSRTPSAVSLQIKRLEELVNVPLFQRDAHRLNLTSEGQALAQYARRILALNDEALASLRQPDVAGRVRLGAPHEYTASLLPEFLGKFAQAHPNVILEVTSDLSRNLLRRQHAGEFDLVIALHEESAVQEGRLIFTEPLVWIGSLDHSAHQQNPLPLVLAPPPCIYRNQMLHALDGIGRPCRIVYLSSSYNGITAAVRAGIGVTAMGSSTIPDGVRVVSERGRLPKLEQLNLRLHRTAGKAPEALLRLEDYIAGSFAESSPFRVTAASAD